MTKASRQQFYALALFAAILIVLSRSRRSSVDLAIPEGIPVSPDNEDLLQRAGVSGIVMTDEGLYMQSWDAWMRGAPKALAMSILESEDPEEILTNAMRRIYPTHQWPPQSGPIVEQWADMVAAVGRSLQRAFPGHLKVVS